MNGKSLKLKIRRFSEKILRIASSFSIRKRRFAVVFLVILLVLIIAAFTVPATIISGASPLSYALYASDGTLLGAQVASDGQWRFEMGKVPEKFAEAIVTFEDKRFYWHPGVDFFSIIRAFRENAASQSIVSGGSTITMQTVRLLEHYPPRTYAQKLHEAVVAVLFELRYSKKHILELYAGNAPFGGNVVGLEAASWRYFARPPSSLSWAEAATLAVLPNQPSLVYPGTNSEILLHKRNLLLSRLFERGKISADEYERSLLEKLPQRPYPLPSISRHYLEYLKKNQKNKSVTKFYTKLNSSMQRNVTRTLEAWSLSFSRREINNAAALILDTKTLDVLAYCANTGNDRNIDTNAVDMIQSRRSSGSLLKPFLFAAMLDAGSLLPEQLVIDIPTRIGNYSPDNNVPKYAGAIPASEALTRSLNIPAIRELRDYGITAFLDILRKSGFTTLDRSSDDYGLPLILGGGEITLWEAARAYSRLMQAALGVNTDNNFPISRGSAYLTLSTLSEGVRPDEEAAWQTFANARRIAWKTGTSNGNRDAWAIGVTSEYTVAVWVGNATGGGTPDLKSASTAAPVLFDLYKTLPRSSWISFPESELVKVQVCTKSGYACGIDCAETKEVFRPRKAPPGSVCPYCRKISLTNDGRYQATADDLTGGQAGIYDGTMPRIESWFVLPPSIEYWFKRANLGYRSLPEFVPWHKNAEAQELSLIFPEAGAKIVIPTEIDGSSGCMVMQAATRNPDTLVYWDIDGTYIGCTENRHELSAHPRSGNHILTVTDSHGSRIQRHFTVLDVAD